MDTEKPTVQGRPRLLGRMRETICRKYYSPRTEEADVRRTKHSIYFVGTRCPAKMSAPWLVAKLLLAPTDGGSPVSDRRPG